MLKQQPIRGRHSGNCKTLGEAYGFLAAGRIHMESAKNSAIS